MKHLVTTLLHVHNNNSELSQHYYVRSLVVQDLRSVLGRSVYPKIFRGIDVCEFQHVMLGGIPFF